MSPSPPSLPERAEEADLVRRLQDGDPTASFDILNAYLEPLIAWLVAHNRRIDADWCTEAAEEAMLALLRKPASYCPERQTLFAYLHMAAQRDLQNILRREQKHYQQRVPWTCVELPSQTGNYLGREDDPSLPLQVHEEQTTMLDQIPAAVRDCLNETEARVLELLLAGERKTAVFAAACGLAHLSTAQQEIAVKRLKDRVKKRLERARKTP